MNVNFDGLRKAVQRDFNRIIHELDKSKEYEGYILVSPANMEKAVDALRDNLVTLMCLESESEGFKSIIDGAPLDIYEAPKEDEGDEEE